MPSAPEIQQPVALVQKKRHQCKFPGCTKRYTRSADAARHYDESHNTDLDAICPISDCGKMISDARKSDKQKEHMRGKHPNENGQLIIFAFFGTIEC
jgi:hypothetical protein